MSIKGISTLLVKGVHAHLHRKLVVDQDLMHLTDRQQNLQHQILGEPKVEPRRLTEPQRLIKPLHLTELRRHRLADHQPHNRQDHHHQVHQIDLLHRDHHHLHAHQV